MLQLSYYSMKKRLGYSNPPKDALLSHRHKHHICPGCIVHNIPHRRKQAIWRRYSRIELKHGHPAYTMYWRSHEEEFNGRTR